MNKNLGLYIHIPFCVSKCSYCDFYSVCYSHSVANEYTQKIISEINRWGAKLRRPADTLYFGGGTPSLLKSEEIAAIISAAKKNLGLNNAEITVEANPKEDLKEWFKEVKKAGVNRVSLGIQSGVREELNLLSRRHSPEDAVKTVEDIKNAGIENFSLDLMLGIPNQTKESIEKSIDFVTGFEPNHISAYLLSVEENTPLFKIKNNLNIPSDDEAGELYLTACRLLEKKGYERYEISNFARNKQISVHNTKYWKCEEYLGLGPAAHSMIDGKRFYYPKNLEEYLSSPIPKEIFEGEGGGFEEEFMLALRLKEGISFKAFSNKYPCLNFEKAKNKTDLYVKGGLMEKAGDRVFLTHKGALVSNTIITELLDEIL